MVDKLSVGQFFFSFFLLVCLFDLVFGSLHLTNIFASYITFTDVVEARRS